MWPFSRDTTEQKSGLPIFFTNTLTRRKERFSSLKPGIATLYSCGPTVYNEAHLGNLRPYVTSDLIARTLDSAGYTVRRVINITDVGHLTSDADDGEDKMEAGAKREGKRAQDIAEEYTKLFIRDIKALGLDTEHILFPRATHYINEQIAMIETLEKKGFTYRIHDGIYFDTSKFGGYGKLGGLSDDDIKAGELNTLSDRIHTAGHARIPVNEEKRNPADFALWKFSPAGERRQQEWSSPWGKGFPGWHIECSAMSKALLGTEIDIHTGGMDHIAIHHNNEIAQSEGSSSRPFVKYWLHGAFLTMNNEKVSKSLGNVIYLSDVIERGIHPLALRYLFIQAHYRSPISFSWEALEASNTALHNLWKLAERTKIESKGVGAKSEIRDSLTTLLRDDIGTPKALALLWETLKDEELGAKIQWGVLLAAEEVLGLRLTNPPQASASLKTTDVPHEVQKLVDEREIARKERDFTKADELRVHILNWGYAVEDGLGGPVLTKS